MTWRRAGCLVGIAAALAAIAAVGPVAAAGGAPLKASWFGGATDQGYSVVAQLAASRRKILQIAVDLSLECDEFRSLGVGYGRNLHIDKSGRFHFRQPFVHVAADPVTGDLPYDISGTLSARLNRAKTTIQGTARYTYVLYDAPDATGHVASHTCDSGLVRFVAQQ